MFEIGKIYNRRSDIHNIYKGQQYGGIATPAEIHIYLFLPAMLAANMAILMILTLTAPLNIRVKAKKAT